MIVINDKIKEIIDLYKADFARIDAEERYKWIAVKHFQDNWDIDAPDFADMLERAFVKQVKLLQVGVERSLNEMISYAKHEPETVRGLFHKLYDEHLPLDSRISDFRGSVQRFVDKKKEYETNFHAQPPMSVYLAFMYPEKYYIYKYRVLKTVAPLFGIVSGTVPVADRLQVYTQMCDSIREVAIADEELITMNRNRLGNDCYQDPNNRILAMDIAFFTFKQQANEDENKNVVSKLPVVTDFKKWLENFIRDNGKPYDPRWFKIYLKLIENEAKKLAPTYDGNTNLFTYDTTASFTPQHEKLLHIIDSGKIQVHNAYPKVLRLYEQFLKRKSHTPPTHIKESYGRENFLDDVFMVEEDYDSLIGLLDRKKNLILQGAPGVGKTFIAKRLAYALIGEKTSERIRFVQFHQSYGYEDFVMGYRPDGSGFKLQYGAFYTFCKKAAADPDKGWYFIIDEINRGNISKIFGELLMLIESDKRNNDYTVRLQGMEEPFFVPDNVYIIGMMNTADRSIALIDYALRRRFAFYTIEPAFKNENFLDYLEEKNSKNLRDIIGQISELNVEIVKDQLLGPGYQIGHSYFVTDEPIDDKLLRDIILYEIKPLLSEYWVDNVDKVRNWTIKLLDAVK